MSCAPLLVGLSAGLVLGDMIRERVRRPLAGGLLLAGLAALAPAAIDALHHKVAGPATRRGSLRTLRRIREGAGVPARDIDFVREELGEMYVG